MAIQEMILESPETPLGESAATILIAEEDPNIREVVVTNTVPVPESKRTELPKLRVLSIAPLLASAIDNIFKCQSVSKVFLDEAVDFAV